jgi:hypothetical protein
METDKLIQVRFQAGRYEGVMTASEPVAIEAVHMGKVVAVADVTADPTRHGDYRVAVDLPAAVMGDGVQMVALRSTGDGTVLGRIALMAGAALDEDIRAELVLLREELEMLKRAFRRHCAETGQD